MALGAQARKAGTGMTVDGKECPFCGAVDLMGFDYPFARRPGVRGCYVKCKQCGASTGNYETLDDAIKAWNTRKDAEK